MISNVTCFQSESHHALPTLSGSARERAEAIAERCGGGRERHCRWQLPCPAHNDDDPSLSLSYDGDHVLVHCFAGCSAEVICAAVGITLADLFADDLPPRSPRPRLPKRSENLSPPPDEENALALELAVQFILRDVTNLAMEGIQRTLREAAAHPLQWLWLEQTLQNHGLSPRVVWQVLYPHAEEAYPEPPTGTGTPCTSNNQTPYERRQATRIGHYKHQLYADPYFGLPEHHAQGIPVARLVDENPEETPHER
jgi:hypothetical protein